MGGLSFWGRLACQGGCFMWARPTILTLPELAWGRGWLIGRPSAIAPRLEPENDAKAHHGHR